MISIINPLSDDKWIKFISVQKNSTIFHHPAWLSVLQRHYLMRVFAVCDFNDRGEIENGIPFCEARGISGRLKWISLPFSDICEPLCKNNEVLEILLNYCLSAKVAKQISRIEIRYPLPKYSVFSKQLVAVYNSIKLPMDANTLFSSFTKRSRVQQGIQKAQRLGLTTRISHDQSALDEFYRLHIKTRIKLGVPIQPKNFFHVIFEQIIKPKIGFFILVYKDSLCIAAGVFFGFNNTFTYKFTASDQNYLIFRPNHLLVWTAMREAINRGYKIFDYGRTDTDNQGLRNFKSGWGSVEEPLYYSYFPSPSSGKMFHIIKNKIVAPIIRNSPPFVCRLTGELFYKYFA